MLSLTGDESAETDALIYWRNDMKRLILALALVVGTAQAGTFWDGNTLYNKLNGSTMEQMQALGYIMGVADALDTATICAPNNVTAGQINDMMKNYLENYPAVRHLAADSLISLVLGRMWPCEKKKGQSL